MSLDLTKDDLINTGNKYFSAVVARTKTDELLDEIQFG